MEAERKQVFLDSVTQVVTQNPIHEKPAKSDRRQKKSPDLLYGRNTDGELTDMEDLELLEGEVVIRGKIQAIEERETKNKSNFIWSVLLTDFTDSIKVKLFLQPGEAATLRPLLQTGMYVKIKGLLSFDSFDKEKAISNVVGISATPDFSVLRRDTAKQKRVELHSHTKASDMDGVSEVRSVVRTAYEWGMPAVAITDHGVVHAFPDTKHERQDL